MGGPHISVFEALAGYAGAQIPSPTPAPRRPRGNVIPLTRVFQITLSKRLIGEIGVSKEAVMVTFPQAVAQAMEFVEGRQAGLWLGRLEKALEGRGIEEDRRRRWTKALAPFLARHALRPELLRPGQVQAFIEEQAESGRFGARALIDLIQALSFFYDSVVEHRELAGEAGHPFDMPAEDWAAATAAGTDSTLTGIGRFRGCGSGTGGRPALPDWSKARFY